MDYYKLNDAISFIYFTVEEKSEFDLVYDINQVSLHTVISGYWIPYNCCRRILGTHSMMGSSCPGQERDYNNTPAKSKNVCKEITFIKKKADKNTLKYTSLFTGNTSNSLLKDITL